MDSSNAEALGFEIVTDDFIPEGVAMRMESEDGFTYSLLDDGRLVRGRPAILATGAVAMLDVELIDRIRTWRARD